MTKLEAAAHRMVEVLDRAMECDGTNTWLLLVDRGPRFGRACDVREELLACKHLLAAALERRER